MQEVILVKLGEIVLKGLNRRTFEDRLLKNIRRRIARAGNFEVYSMQSTIYIEPKDEDADIDEALAYVKRTWTPLQKWRRNTSMTHLRALRRSR